MYASKIVSYAQGFTLMRAAAKTYSWNLNYGGIALMWRGGCIIRSVFLGKIKEAFDKNYELTNLLLDPYFREKIEAAQDSWRKVVATAVLNGVPVPAFASARTIMTDTEAAIASKLTAGAKRLFWRTYERVDKPRGEFFHTN